MGRLEQDLVERIESETCPEQKERRRESETRGEAEGGGR